MAPARDRPVLNFLPNADLRGSSHVLAASNVRRGRGRRARSRSPLPSRSRLRGICGGPPWLPMAKSLRVRRPRQADRAPYRSRA